MTECDPAEKALLDLSPGQQLAVEALLTGATHADAAAAAGVSRETVSRWSSRHPAFRAAINRYRRSLASDQRDALRRLRGKALAAVESAIDSGNVAVALGVLKMFSASFADDLAIGPAQAADVLDREVDRVRASLPPRVLPTDRFGLPDPLASLAPDDTHGRARRLVIERISQECGE